MAASLPYLSSYKNVEKLFAAIASAKVPETFTQQFLAQTLGLKASNDRPLIPFLRALGFIDGSGRPTSPYRELKNPARARSAIAAAVRRAYAPLFEANEAANALTGDQLRGLIAQVAGTDAEMTKRIAWTFSAVTKLGDFEAAAEGAGGSDEEEEEAQPRYETERKQNFSSATLRPEFHYNFQVHLPANGTEDTYLNIFNALRRVFQ